MKKRVVIGLLGTQLDAAPISERWHQWRPSVAICQHEDLLIDRFQLLYGPKYRGLAETVATDIQAVSPETTVELRSIEFDDPWDFEEVYGALHDFASECRFRPEEEEYLINITTGTHVAQICLFLLTESRHLPGRLLQLSPPSRRGRQEPIGKYRLIDLDLSKYDRLATRFQKERLAELSYLKSGIETRNAHFNRLIEQIEHVALNSNAPILLTGPTGAGKSQLARRIYDMKLRWQRVTGNLVELNCAILRGDQAMSALFGHVKGAFTGATTDRGGLLRAADGGMLFLDEIGELGTDEQAMLLRALEEKRFLPVGSDSEVGSQFQLMAGTNRDLKNAVSQGRFREDLLARINLWTFELPGLANRREDIEPNIQFELDLFASSTGNRVTFNKEARTRFLAFAVSSRATWKANFRDLNAAMVRMATLAPSGRITVDDVEHEVERLVSAWKTNTSGKDEQLLTSILGDEKVYTLDRFDRVQLAEVIRVCQRSRSLSEAGRELFSVSRLAKKKANDTDRLRKFLARFDLNWNDVR